ncbi:MAG: enoyl-CoA hydratase [Halieaceae bacterium]|nr:enoyl-CoA hydratase [Halieaceae bacterium]
MSYVLVEKPLPHVSCITLNRPERMNAMAFDVMVPFREALEEVSFDNDTRVVIITGAGEGFCSGADLEDPGWMDIFDGLTMPGIARRAMRILDDVVKTIHGLHQPVIAAINGPAIGGGFCLAMAADIRVASERARFRAAGINNGLTSGELGLSYLLPKAIGSTRAFEIMLSGRDVDAGEAERIGIVSHCVAHERLLEECHAIAERIIGYSQLGVELSKQLLWAGLDAGSLPAHMNHEGHAQLFVRMTTKNFEEAVKARREGRAPDYKD